jgi:hypothetical protein
MHLLASLCSFIHLSPYNNLRIGEWILQNLMSEFYQNLLTEFLIFVVHHM